MEAQRLVMLKEDPEAEAEDEAKAKAKAKPKQSPKMVLERSETCPHEDDDEETGLEKNSEGRFQYYFIHHCIAITCSSC